LSLFSYQGLTARVVLLLLFDVLITPLLSKLSEGYLVLAVLLGLFDNRSNNSGEDLLRSVESVFYVVDDVMMVFLLFVEFLPIAV